MDENPVENHKLKKSSFRFTQKFHDLKKSKTNLCVPFVKRFAEHLATQLYTTADQNSRRLSKLQIGIVERMILG